MENKELKERFIDERTGIEYVRQGDYYIPNLVLPKQKKIRLNKYGRMRLNYLKEHKKAEYVFRDTFQKQVVPIGGIFGRISK